MWLSALIPAGMKPNKQKVLPFFPKKSDFAEKRHGIGKPSAGGDVQGECPGATGLGIACI